MYSKEKRTFPYLFHLPFQSSHLCSQEISSELIFQETHDLSAMKNIFQAERFTKFDEMVTFYLECF